MMGFPWVWDSKGLGLGGLCRNGWSSLRSLLVVFVCCLFCFVGFLGRPLRQKIYRNVDCSDRRSKTKKEQCELACPSILGTGGDGVRGGPLRECGTECERNACGAIGTGLLQPCLCLFDASVLWRPSCVFGLFAVCFVRELVGWLVG